MWFVGALCPRPTYFRLPLFLGASLWLRALPAAVFDALPVRPSLRTFDAADAAFLLVFLAILCHPLRSTKS